MGLEVGMGCAVETELLWVCRDGVGCYMLLHVAQRGCGVPSLENLKNLIAYDPKQPD